MNLDSVVNACHHYKNECYIHVTYMYFLLNLFNKINTKAEDFNFSRRMIYPQFNCLNSENHQNKKSVYV